MGNLGWRCAIGLDPPCNGTMKVDAKSLEWSLSMPLRSSVLVLKQAIKVVKSWMKSSGLKKLAILIALIICGGFEGGGMITESQFWFMAS